MKRSRLIIGSIFGLAIVFLAAAHWVDVPQLPTWGMVLDCITRDGSRSASGNHNWGGNNLTGVGTFGATTARIQGALRVSGVATFDSGLGSSNTVTITPPTNGNGLVISGTNLTKSIAVNTSVTEATATGLDFSGGKWRTGNPLIYYGADNYITPTTCYWGYGTAGSAWLIRSLFAVAIGNGALPIPNIYASSYQSGTGTVLTVGGSTSGTIELGGGLSSGWAGTGSKNIGGTSVPIGNIYFGKARDSTNKPVFFIMFSNGSGTSTTYGGSAKVANVWRKSVSINHNYTIGTFNESTVVATGTAAITLTLPSAASWRNSITATTATVGRITVVNDSTAPIKIQCTAGDYTTTATSSVTSFWNQTRWTVLIFEPSPASTSKRWLRLQ